MKLCKHIIHIFSQIDWRKAKNEKIHRIYMTNNRNLIPPREIQAGKLDESSATKLPQGHLVWQSGQGEHSPEGNLTEGTEGKGAGSFHTHRKTMKELCTLAVFGVREQPNLAQNLVTHRY